MLSKEFFTDIKDQKITVLGAERSGIGAARLLKRLGAVPFVSDMASKEKLGRRIDELNNEGIDFETGGHSERVFDCKFIVVSPGVPSTSTAMIEAAKRQMQVIPEIELAYYYCKGTIIAITGTNGKTTTTALIDHLLKTAGKNSIAAGNIGRAFSEVVLDIPPDGFVSLEVSSFQLDHIINFRPSAALILNITPDHLNRYENSMKLYAEAKYKIFKNFDESNLLVLNHDNDFLAEGKLNTKGRVRYFSLSEKMQSGINRNDEEIAAYTEGCETFRCKLNDISLRGEHNHANAMAAIEAVSPYIRDNNVIIEGLKSFKGIEHRLEFVRELDGVVYINDSKATNIDSVWYALRSFDNPLFLILGGQDKGNDYGIIRDLVLQKVQKIYAIGSSADKIFKYFHNDIKVEIKSTLEEAVLTANSEARKGDVVLLSPACASFDMFKNFEHRGEMFKIAVGNLG